MSDTAHATSYALTDSWTMTRRELARWARQPVAVAVNLAFPVMMLLMFGYLVGGGRGVSGDYLDYLIPGMLASPWPSAWRAPWSPSPVTWRGASSTASARCP